MTRPSRPRISLPDLSRRITGFPTPVFGVSWTPSAAEHAVVRGFLTFLEDRRVLFQPFLMEVEHEVHRSVHAIRQRCAEDLTKLDAQSRAVGPIRAIRAACRRFLDETPDEWSNRFHDSPSFFTALGELRGSVGVQIAILAVHYKIELEDELASIVPAGDEDGAA